MLNPHVLQGGSNTLTRPPRDSAAGALLALGRPGRRGLFKVGWLLSPEEPEFIPRPRLVLFVCLRYYFINENGNFRCCLVAQSCLTLL